MSDHQPKRVEYLRNEADALLMQHRIESRDLLRVYAKITGTTEFFQSQFHMLEVFEYTEALFLEKLIQRFITQDFHKCLDGKQKGLSLPASAKAFWDEVIVDLGLPTRLDLGIVYTLGTPHDVTLPANAHFVMQHHKFEKVGKTLNTIAGAAFNEAVDQIERHKVAHFLQEQEGEIVLPQHLTQTVRALRLQLNMFTHEES